MYEVTDMKDNNKKEIKYLNVCMNKALHEKFEAFCKAHGIEPGWSNKLS
jgi:hypothetical protein